MRSPATPRRDSRSRDDKRLVQFHYDASNDFYRLFLDAGMVYSCAYFENLRDRSRHCADRQARPHLQEALGCAPASGSSTSAAAGCPGLPRGPPLRRHRARRHPVPGAARPRPGEGVQELGLGDRVTLALEDYRNLDGQWDKIASIGMYEHVGIDNYPAYFKKLGKLLAPGGILLNHGITRRAKKEKKAFRRLFRQPPHHPPLHLPRRRARPYRPHSWRSWRRLASRSTTWPAPPLQPAPAGSGTTG
ncbi:MAG: class I SAM-dependent methyltransferase [Geminicoccaceae bacterium]